MKIGISKKNVKVKIFTFKDLNRITYNFKIIRCILTFLTPNLFCAIKYCWFIMAYVENSIIYSETFATSLHIFLNICLSIYIQRLIHTHIYLLDEKQIKPVNSSLETAAQKTQALWVPSNSDGKIGWDFFLPLFQISC